jgi:glycosyltransferase involved in cell wall biosynthesis
MNSAGQTICLSMIVRNEAHVIRRCLESVMPFIDAWVIVDTGSNDGTQEIIRTQLSSIPGELFERPWVNFAHNRNEALDLAAGHGDYILVIDADETLECDAGFSMPPLTADSCNIEVRYGGCSYLRKQLVRASLPWRYAGVLHEYIHCAEARGEAMLAGIRTVPRHDGARARDPQTYRRDALLLENALLDDPNDTRYVFYLAQSYRDAGEHELAIRHYKHRAEMGGWSEEVWFSLYQIAVLRERLGHAWPEVMQDYLTAYQCRPDRAGPLYRVGLHYQSRREYHLAHVYLSAASRIPMPASNRLFVERPVYEYLLPVELAVASHYVGDHEAAIETNNALLRSGVLPPHAVPQVIRNRRAGLDALLPRMRGASLAAVEVAVIVPFTSADDQLEECLASLRAQTSPFRAILVDDGEQAAPLDLGDERFTFRRNDTPVGWEASVAAAVSSLAPDTVVVPLRLPARLAQASAIAAIREPFEEAGCALLYGQNDHGDAEPASGARAFAARGAALAGHSPLIFRASLLGDGTPPEPSSLWQAAGWNRTRFTDTQLTVEGAGERRKTPALPMISCLMITRDRLELARRSIRCFADQSYPNRELVIVTDGEPQFREALTAHAKELGLARFRIIVAERGTPLGKLRNLSLDAAAGEIVCQWDDDDANHPDRLMVQTEALFRENARAAFFTDHLQFLEEKKLLFWIDWTMGGKLSDQRQYFPGSLLMFKDERFRYPEEGDYARRGEDSVLLEHLMKAVPIARVSGMGHLYLYHYHGRNTFDRQHHYHMSTCSTTVEHLRSKEEAIRKAVAYYGLTTPITVAGSNGTAFEIGTATRRRAAAPQASFAERLAEALAADEAFRGHALTVELVKEMRGYTTRLHCVDLECDGQRERCWVKEHVAAPHHAQEEWSFLRRRAPFREFDLAEPVAYLPSLQALITRHADGQRLEDTVATSNGDAAPAIRATGAWLGQFHRDEIAGGTAHPADALLDDIGKRLAAVARLFPITSASGQAMMREAARRAQSTPAADLRRVRTHGDFGLFNIITAGSAGTIIDPSFEPSIARFGNYCTRHEDFARFLASLAAARNLSPGRRQHLAAEFHAGYCEASSGVDPLASPAMALLRTKYGLQALIDRWPRCIDEARRRGIESLIAEWLG